VPIPPSYNQDFSKVIPRGFGLERPASEEETQITRTEFCGSVFAVDSKIGVRSLVNRK